MAVCRGMVSSATASPRAPKVRREKMEEARRELYSGLERVRYRVEPGARREAGRGLGGMGPAVRLGERREGV